MASRPVVTKAEATERLRAVPLFVRCTKRDLRTVARHLEMVTIAAGETVVTEGAHGETFFHVLGGTLSVTVDGKQRAALGPGQHFGELALLDPGPRSATLTTIEDCELGVLGARMFRVLLRDMPQISAGLLASLASQLRDERACPVQ